MSGSQPIDTDYFAPPNYVRYVKKLVQQEQYDYLWLNYIEYAALAIQLKKDFKLKIFIDIHDLYQIAKCLLQIKRLK